MFSIHSKGDVIIKVLILGGFLGSGKTSVLIQLAKYLVKTSPGSQDTPNVVIIENEIGAAGVDNLLLENADYTVKNLFAGCACCTSSAQLTDTILFLGKEYNPEWLIIEATGLASPSKIKSTVETELELKALTLDIVDAQRWFRLVNAMESFVTEQLEGAAAVLINKIDLVDRGTVERITENVRKYVHDAGCYPVSATNELSDKFWEEIVKGADI